MRDTRADVPLLAQIAETTGGLVVEPTALAEVISLADLSPRMTQQTERRALWDRWMTLGIVFGCLCAEWILRKRVGLA